MGKKMNKKTRQMVIVFVMAIILFLIAALPKEEAFVCVYCGETVKQIPKAAPVSFTGIVGHDYTNFKLEDEEKLCDACYDLLKTYSEIKE